MDQSQTNYTAQKTHLRINWLLSAFLSLIFLGTGSFICGLNSGNPYGVFCMSATAYCTFGLICFLIQLIRHKCNARFLKQQFISKRQISGLYWCIIGGIFGTLGQLLIFSGFKEDPLNKGSVLSMSSGQAIFSTLLAYIIFNEILSLNQIVGIIISTTGLILICYVGLASGTFKGALWGLGAAIFYSVRNVGSKFSKKNGINSGLTFIVFGLTSGIIGWLVTLFIILIDKSPLQDTKIIYGFIGGFSKSIGIYFLNYSVMQGYVGPSTIVADFGSILVFFFDYIFLGITPNVYKLIGAFIAIVGIIVMVYKDIRKK